MTWFAAAFYGAAAAEDISGVRVLRDGNHATVHFKAFAWYRRTGRGQFDVVVDEVNTVPFFAPLYCEVPVVAFFHQLAREVWFYESTFPVNVAGFWLEPFYLKPYRDLPAITVSASSQQSLREVGFRGSIAVIPEAIDWDADRDLPPLSAKEPELTLISLGRAVPSKRIEQVIRALKHIHESGVRAFLWIVGDGERAYLERLRREVTRMGVSGFVGFLGRVGDLEKRRLLARAHVVVACSVREGWGLIVTEAHQAGTPSVTYDVPGLRDSTRHMVTGLVCTQNTPADLAKHVLTLFRARDLYVSVRQSAWERAAALNWDDTARQFESALCLGMRGGRVEARDCARVDGRRTS